MTAPWLAGKAGAGAAPFPSPVPVTGEWKKKGTFAHTPLPFPCFD